ncbi:MAG: nucleotidyltransferase family protein [Bacilli bacterium]
MKTLGLILELNPFHNGHEYFIKQAIEKVNPDVTIAIISSNFAMRGEPMVMDKWEKSKFCLSYGIDIVLELPFLGSVSSADYFCYNSIKTLTDFQITDLAFGVELENIDKIVQMKNILNNNEFNNLVKKYLSLGNSYSTSNLKALKEFTDDQEIIDNFSLPNNTLAIGYLKSLDKLNKNININLIKRIKNNYYDEDITDNKINSATSIRNLLSKNEDISNYVPIPGYVYHNPDDMNKNILSLLRYVFSVKDIQEIENTLGMNEGIENRILSFIYKSDSYEDLITNIQTKRYSLNKIRRLLLHTLLNITKEHENKYHYYHRILSMNNKGKKFVSSLPNHVKEVILTTFKNQNNYLVDIELKASKLYGLLINQPNIYLNEFNVPYIGEK